MFENVYSKMTSTLKIYSNDNINLISIINFSFRSSYNIQCCFSIINNKQHKYNFYLSKYDFNHHNQLYYNEKQKLIRFLNHCFYHFTETEFCNELDKLILSAL